MAFFSRMSPLQWTLRCITRPTCIEGVNAIVKIKSLATFASPPRAPAHNSCTKGGAYGLRTHSHRSSSAEQIRVTDVPDLIRRLSDTQRKTLLKELKKYENETAPPNPDAASTADSACSPSTRQLSYVAVVSGVPFIAFGLLDNTIMICAGEYIDITFGTMLGISTMAAAGLGNMCSDIVGISTANFVEHGLRKIGFRPPGLSAEMLQRRSARWSANFGRVIGVSIGCLLGLFPLLFLENGGRDSEVPADAKIAHQHPS